MKTMEEKKMKRMGKVMSKRISFILSTIAVIATILIINMSHAQAAGLADLFKRGGLNTAFNGEWRGTTTLKNGEGRTYITSTDTPQVVEVQGSKGTLKGVCFDGTGNITATGSGNTAEWGGTLYCQPVSFGTAYTNVTITLTSAKASLSNDGRTMTAEATGTATGFSSQTETIYLYFKGTK